MTEFSSLAATLRWLVDIPSVTGNEEEICLAICDRLGDSYPKREIRGINNSLAVGPHSGERPLVLLVGHTDTVPNQGQGPAVVSEGRLHGLGAADMKGGLAVMLHLLEDEDVRNGPYDVVGIFYEAEEGPSANNGLEPVMQRLAWLADAEMAVVLEPSDREIQLGCNGVINASVTFTGKAAHSARPWWGENAVTKAGEWLAGMHSRQPDPVIIDGLEYREVMSVTRASGGVANNVIPASFTLNLNYRFSPLRTMDEAVEVVTAACADADSVEIVDRAPAGKVEADHPLVERLAQVSGSSLAAKQGWTDVARLSQYGVTAFNFGPGEAVNAHQVDESVALDDLDHAYDALRLILTEG